MRITWVTRSFLDYRIPVYGEIDRLCDNQLTVIFYADVVPERCHVKIGKIIPDRAIGLTGEMRFSGRKLQAISSMGKNKIRVPFQPGLIKIIKESKPDVILCDGFYQWTYAALWLRFLKGIPVVMCYEGTMHTEINSGMFRTYYRKAASKLIDRIICNGSLSAEYVEWLGFSRSKITLGNMAADSATLNDMANRFLGDERNQLKEKLGLNQHVFLYIGRLVPLKGVDKLIEVWTHVFGRSKETSLLIVGDGPEKDSLQVQTEREDCTNVCFTGAIDYDLIYKYFSIADVFVIPTLQDNWSLVVPEAMSVSLPIICSKYNGCWPELVKPKNGWVFDPLDYENFVDTLNEVWDKHRKWKEMGQQSLNIVQDFTPEKVAQNIYSACLKVTGTTD
jgi:glycosyltransferase involved in cell wall biosynthesis